MSQEPQNNITIVVARRSGGSDSSGPFESFNSSTCMRDGMHPRHLDLDERARCTLFPRWPCFEPFPDLFSQYSQYSQWLRLVKNLVENCQGQVLCLCRHHSTNVVDLRLCHRCAVGLRRLLMRATLRNLLDTPQLQLGKTCFHKLNIQSVFPKIYHRRNSGFC